MTSELQIALDNLLHIVRKENGSDGNCVAVRIFINSEGYEITYEHRTSESLKKDYISMHNICGEFIK